MKLAYVCFRDSVDVGGQLRKHITGAMLPLVAELDRENRTVRVGDVEVPLENVVCWRVATQPLSTDTQPLSTDTQSLSKSPEPVQTAPTAYQSKSQAKRLAVQRAAEKAGK